MKFFTKLNFIINNDIRFHALIRYNSVKKFLNLLVTEFQKVLRCSYLYSYPFRMTIEPTNVCNLKCIYCHTGKGERGRPRGFISFGSFKRLIDELGHYMYTVDIYKSGEPFLNKEIFDMIKLAEDTNICTSIHSNFNVHFNEEDCKKLIRSGLSYLTLSLDGADQEVYSIYRKKGNFEQAIENAKLIIEMKRKLRKQKPFVIWQFLAFPHNRHQIEKAKDFATELGFDSFVVHAGVTPSNLYDYAKDKGDKDKIPKRKDMIKPKCDWLWTNAVFHWDGGVAPCCFQFWEKEDFGSIKDDNFKKIWNNEKFIYARSLFGYKGKRSPYPMNIICNKCLKVKSSADDFHV